MKLNIEARFNIGDAVYVADSYYDYYANHTPYIISDILIRVNNKNIRIMYYVKQEGRTYCFPEHLCFATYTECTKWCKEHN